MAYVTTNTEHAGRKGASSFYGVRSIAKVASKVGRRRNDASAIAEYEEEIAEIEAEEREAERVRQSIITPESVTTKGDVYTVSMQDIYDHEGGPRGRKMYTKLDPAVAYFNDCVRLAHSDIQVILESWNGVEDSGELVQAGNIVRVGLDLF